MATVSATIPAGSQLVLSGVPWETYTRVLRIFADRRLRITYDHGALEIMTTSLAHEHLAHILGRIIEALAEELNIAIYGGKSTTFRRRGRQRGLEADECYWIANESRVRGLARINLRRDPPPDLAVEVEVSRSALNRLAIYAALRVPEVWRFDGQSLTFYHLDISNQYVPVAASLSFPQLKSVDLLSFLTQHAQLDDTTLVRQFREWVRLNIVGGGPSSPAP